MSIYIGDDKKEDKSIQLILSILLAVSLGKILEYLTISELGHFVWLFFSVLSIGLIIIITYFILEINIFNKFRTISRIVTLTLLIFIPYVLQRTTPAGTLSPNVEILPPWGMLLYFIFLGISFIVWSISERYTKKEITTAFVVTLIFGIIIVIGSIGAFAIISGK